MCNSIQRNDGKDGGAEVEVPSGLGSCVVSVRQHLAHLGEVLSATSRSAKKPLIVQIIDCRHSTSFLGKQRRLFHAILPFHLSQDIATELCFPLPLHRLVAVSFRRRLEAAHLVPVLLAPRNSNRRNKCRFRLAVVFDGILPAKPRQPIRANRNAPSPELPAETTAPSPRQWKVVHPMHPPITIQLSKTCRACPSSAVSFRPFRSSAKSSRSITAFRSSRPTMPTTIIPSCDKRMAISIRFASPVRARARAVRLLC